MEGGEGRLDSSLPPDYVSLAQLQERWIRRQEEMKLKRKEEEEQKEREARIGNWSDENRNRRGLENELHEKIAGLSVRDVPPGKGEKDSRKRGVIEDKGKGKEGEKDGRKRGVIEDKGKGKAKVIGGFQDGEEKKKYKKRRDSRKKERTEFRSEIKEFDGGDGSKGVEIVLGNEVKEGIKGILSGESSGRDGGLKGTEEIEGVYKGEVFPRYVKRVDYRSGFKSKKEYGKKTEHERWYGMWRERRNGEYEARYTLKENRADVLRGNEAEPKGEDRAEDGVLEICNETGGIYGKNKNDDGVELEEKVEDGVLEVCNETGHSNGKNKNDDGVELEEKVKNGGLEVCNETSGANGKNKNDDGVELKEKVEDGVLEVCNETGGVNGKNKNDDGVELEEKADDEVLVVQSAKSGENGRFGNGYRRYGNWRENMGKKYGGFTYNDRNNVRYMMGVKDGVGRRYTRFGSSGDRRKMKPRESGMMWVKKEEKNGADAAEIGSSGIPMDQA